MENILFTILECIGILIEFAIGIAIVLLVAFFLYSVYDAMF